MVNHNKPIYPKRIWQVDDKMFLRQHYNTMPMPEIMSHLRRTDEAIHCMASHLGITGHRYGVNNYLTGKSYKKDDRKEIPQRKTKKVPTKPVTTVIGGRKRKPKSRRWYDQKLPIKPFTAEGKKLIRIDHRTVIYVPTNASPNQIEKIIARYKKTA